MALVTALAMQAGWLYGGTLVAGVIVTVRKLRLMARAVERERERADREGRARVGGQGGQGQVRASDGQARPPYGHRPVGPRTPRPPAQPRRAAPRGH